MDWRSPTYPAFPTEDSCPEEFQHIKGSEIEIPFRYQWMVCDEERFAIAELDARRKAWVVACNKIYAEQVLPAWEAWRDDPDRERTRGEIAGFDPVPPHAPSIWEEVHKIKAAAYRAEKAKAEAKASREAKKAEEQKAAIEAAAAAGQDVAGAVATFNAVERIKDWQQQRKGDSPARYVDVDPELEGPPGWLLDRLAACSDNQLEFLYFLCCNPVVGPGVNSLRGGDVYMWGFQAFTKRGAEGGIPAAWKDWLLTVEGMALVGPIAGAQPAPAADGPPGAVVSLCHWEGTPELDRSGKRIRQGRLLVHPRMAALVRRSLDPFFGQVQRQYRSIYERTLRHPDMAPDKQDLIEWFFYDDMALSKAPSGPGFEQWIEDYKRLPGVLRPSYRVACGLSCLPNLASNNGLDFLDFADVKKAGLNPASVEDVQAVAWRDLMDSLRGTTDAEESYWQGFQISPFYDPNRRAEGNNFKVNVRLMTESIQEFEQGHRERARLPKKPS